MMTDLEKQVQEEISTKEINLVSSALTEVFSKGDTLKQVDMSLKLVDLLGDKMPMKKVADVLEYLQSEGSILYAGDNVRYLPLK